MRLRSVVLMGVAFAAGAFAGEVETIAKRWKTAGEFSLAVAEAMPAESWNFAPNAEEMGFGKLMVHIAVYNNMMVGTVTGVKPPEAPEKIAAVHKDPKGTIDKDAAIQFLKDSAAFCDQALKELTPARLEQMFGPEGRQASGRERLWLVFTHTAHHRGQAQVYLRVKGIKPPGYRF